VHACVWGLSPAWPCKFTTVVGPARAVALAYSRGVLLLARLGMRRWSSADPPSNRARPGSSRQRNTAHARWDPPQRFAFFSFRCSSGQGQVSWTYALVRGCSGASQPGRVGRRRALVCGCRLVKKMRSRPRLNLTYPFCRFESESLVVDRTGGNVYRFWSRQI
jgi:hypothetical protein